MKIKHISLGLIGLAFAVLQACHPEIDTPIPNRGEADFSKFIAIGNSLTSGFADGGLYLEGQQSAYPLLIAQQMKQVGGGDFVSPFFTADQANGSGYIQLTGFDANGRPVTAKVTDQLAYRNSEGTLLTKYSGEVDNLGIPGMRLDLGTANQFSSANMYFERLLPDTQVGQTSYLNFIQNRNHTFFSFWLGNNDVLGWATNGGVISDATTVLTSKSDFTALYNNYIAALTAQGQKGVVATIPDVTSLPFFNTVTVAAINAAIAANEDVQNNPLTKGARLKISALNPQTQLYESREATDKDLIILTFNTASIGTTVNGIPGYGLLSVNPVANAQVLDEAEIAIAKDYVSSYNTSIKSIAVAKGLALVDAYAILNRIQQPQIYDGITVSSAFITGNVFSLDGIHLTPLGNAIIANEFIAAINAAYHSNVPKVNISSYRGVKFPEVLTD